MHDPETDLHFYRTDTYGLVHPHTRRGFGYLAFKLGQAEMERYNAEESYHPRLTLEALKKLCSEASDDGLSIELTVPTRG